MKNAFYLTFRALFVLNISKVLSWHCGHVEKQLVEINEVNFKIYDVKISEKKQLQYTSCPISQEINGNRQCNWSTNKI